MKPKKSIVFAAIVAAFSGMLAAPVHAIELCSDYTPDEVFLQFLGTTPKFKTSGTENAHGEAQRLELIARQLGYTGTKGYRVLQSFSSYRVCVSFWQMEPLINDTSLRGLLVRLNKLSHEIRIVVQAILTHNSNNSAIVDHVKKILMSLAELQSDR